MRTPNPENDENELKPFLPIFVCAIIFGGTIRIIEIVVIAISTRNGYYDFWLSSHLRPFGVVDLVLACAMLFLGVSALCMIVHGFKASSLAAFLFCLLLVVYCGGIKFLCESSRRESIGETSEQTIRLDSHAFQLTQELLLNAISPKMSGHRAGFNALL